MMAAKTLEFLTDTLTIEKNKDGSKDLVCWPCEESTGYPDELFFRDHKDCKSETEFDCGYSTSDAARDDRDARAIYS